ncbi:phytanoyl-CoA dioxygenase family protein [Chloroflexi bacterium TSY]|nr:phytanoyl-CoA dioxygenase family protein [Chloroflexi bacterium TSY]
MSQLTPATTEISLNEAQIQSFWDDGFLVVDDVFPSEDVALLREAVASPEVMQDWRQLDPENRTVHLLEITVKHPLMMELARSERILKRITQLIGPDIQLQHSKLATKPPAEGKGPFAWHQDFAFFPHTNSDLVAVMVMLDDATPENGCMQMVRGSYKLGLLDHDEAGLFHGRCQESHLWEDEARVANITPKVGGISIHHALTLHGSPANLSGKPRRGVVFQYRADDAFQLADGVWADTGLLMCGERRERARCDAGVLRLPKSNRYPDHPFGHAWHQDGELAQQRDYFAK